jgi:exodeoxyribonuclease V alpha subunit
MPQMNVRIKKVIYKSPPFYILSATPEKEQSGSYFTVKDVVVSGNFYALRYLVPGSVISVTGNYVNHDKYGKQFKTSTWGYPKGAVDHNPVDFLNDTCGLSLETCDWLSTTFEEPDKIYSALDDLDSLISKVTDPEIRKDLLSWQMALSARDLSVLLSDYKIPDYIIAAAVAHFKDDAYAVVSANPYALLETGVASFKLVDAVGYAMGISLSDPRRIEAAILGTLKGASTSGNVFLNLSYIPSALAELDCDRAVQLKPPYTEDLIPALRSLKEKKAITVESKNVYLTSLHTYESESARHLSDLIGISPLTQSVTFVEDFEKTSDFTLSEEQKSAIDLVLQNRVTVITGLPGTGKTTVVRAIVSLLRDNRSNYALMAPTGIAAKRLSQVSGASALTIHRSLAYNGTTWGHNSSDPIPQDSIVVDEMSMVDQELFYRLVSSLRSDARLILVGDDAQLPSVGPGNVLRELVSCGVIPHIQLKTIFRQKDLQGGIVLNSHKINRGEYPKSDPDGGAAEFSIIPLKSEETAKDFILRAAKRLKDKDASFQIISPKYSGAIGVNALNDSLRDLLNPAGPPEWSRKDLRFRLGDRLMIIKNNLQKGVFNGDTGKLVDISRDSLTVKVYSGSDTDGPDADVTFTATEALVHLKLAYAITVHKSQGCEFDTIIIPVFRSQGRLLQRNLLYTAVTRAKKRVILVGDPVAINMSVDNNKTIHRFTALGSRLAGVAR